MRTKEWTDIPTDVVESIRKAVWFYRLIARNVVNDCYDDWWNREGLSLDLDNAADHLEMVLEEYGYPGRHELLSTVTDLDGNRRGFGQVARG